MTALWLRNIGVYSLQILLLVAAGAALLSSLKIRLPKARLACWQALLAICVLLPGLEPWQRASAPASVQIALGPFTPVVRDHRAGFPLPLVDLLLVLLGTGAVIRLGMLALGFWRLRRYRGDSLVAREAFQDLQQRLGVRAAVHISSDISGPVTFGVLHPVILVPAECLEDEPVACHELLHVRRRDWLFTVIEECALSLFWFHPAMWWLIAQIQLAREEAVDRDAVAILNSRERYLESLLALAASKAGLDLAPASPFLRKRHLRKRVACLMKEVSMSTTRLSSSIAAFAAMLALSAWLGVRSFPLQAAPQDRPDAGGVTVDQNGLTLLHRVPVAYPREAKEKGIEGDVLVELTLAANGTVSDARVLNGPEELRRATLESVLQWHYANDARLPAKTQATVKFRLAQTAPATALPMVPLSLPDGAGTVKQIDFRVPDALRAKLEGRIAVHEGDQLTQASLNDLTAAVREVDQHLSVGIQATPDKSGLLVAIALQTGPPQRIRVGGNLQQANLIQKIQPHYPVQAKLDHIQGKVQLSVLIGKDGHVQNIDLLSGEPVLADAAREAVAQWVYKPTLLNGQPVEVLTQVDVNFTLSQ